MEQLILKKLSQGNEQAVELIFKQNYVILCKFAYAFLKDKCLAEEVVDDSILYLWEHRDEIQIKCSIRSYLLKAVRNGCFNKIRTLEHLKETSCYMSQENMDFIDMLFIDEEQPLGTLLYKELEQKLYEEINYLPLECRTVFKKSRFENMSYEDIAMQLNVSVNTVKYHIKNALRILEKKMKIYLEISLFIFFMQF